MSRRTKNRGAPGNAVEEQTMFDNMVYGVGRGWLEMERAVDDLLDDEIVVKRVSMKGDWRVSGDILIIVTADGPDGPVVCFHRGDSILDVWSGLARRLLARSMDWKADEYAQKR